MQRFLKRSWDDVFFCYWPPTLWHRLTPCLLAAICEAGYYLNPANHSECWPCDYGFYQPNASPTSDVVCSECPNGTYTRQMASDSGDQCQSMYRKGVESPKSVSVWTSNVAHRPMFTHRLMRAPDAVSHAAPHVAPLAVPHVAPHAASHVARHV